MKTILAIIVTAATCFIFLNREGTPAPRIGKAPPAPAATPKPAAAEVDLSGVPPALIQHAQEKGYRKDVLKKSFAEYANTEPRQRLFKAEVIQQLDSGHLLIRCGYVKPHELCVPRGTYALWGAPDAGLIVDGAEIDGYALPTGVYRYLDTAGSQRTIYELAYFHDRVGKEVVAKAAVPAQTPTPTPDPAVVGYFENELAS